MDGVSEGQLIEAGSLEIAGSVHREPAIIEQAGSNARFAWDEFFAIDNEHTRIAYQNAVERFFGWCSEEGRELSEIMPGDVTRYLKQMVNLRTGLPTSKETKQLHLSAIRQFLDVLVQRHAILLNPALSVRRPKSSSKEGKTPPIPESKVSELFESIDTANVVGLRDRAILGVLLYTAARRGAVAHLRIRDFWTDGVQYFLRFHEKGGKVRDIPVRHDLQEWLHTYIRGADLENEPADAPLFRKAIFRTGLLASDGMEPRNISDLAKRRFRNCGLPDTLTVHSFRATTITNLLSQDGVNLESVQDLAGHADARTTRKYDHSSRKVNRNLVERICF